MKRVWKQSEKSLIVIAGPTASGKSDLALALAKLLNTEIISADSRQLYRGLDIGTAKPSNRELEDVSHHFIDHLDVEETYSAALYEKEAYAKIETVLASHQHAILVGGTGLYIKAILEGLDSIPTVESTIVEEWEGKLETKGLSFLQDQLRGIDPDHAGVVDMKNPRRLVRALSVHSSTGQPYSSFLQKTSRVHAFQVRAFCLAPPREKLYQRINSRVDLMVDSGLVEEARKFISKQEYPSLRTVGYQEFFPFFRGEYDLDEAIRLVRRNTRRYAKRQMTWFRNQGEWEMIEEQNLEDQVKRILNLKERFPSP